MAAFQLEQVGVPHSHPYLYPSLCEDISFLPYLPPTFQDGGEVDPLWVEAVEQLDSDLHWLLRLPHLNFWSQIVLDSSLQKSLDSYLRHAPRIYDRPLNLPLKVKEIQRNVHKRVFMTFLRVSTAKESENQHFTPAMHADLIYKYYLFDLPKLMDLCVLYIGSNKPLLSKMVANVFKAQPSYTEDWALTVHSFAEILKKVSDKALPAQGAVLLTAPPESLSSEELTDLVLYLSDTTSTLKAFLDVYPPAVGGLLQGGFLDTLVNFYESVVPVLQREWLEVRGQVTDAQYVKTRFRQFKSDSTWIINSILRLYFDLPMGASEESSQVSLDNFIAAVTLVFTEKSFLREFEKHYSLASLVHEMQQLHPELPESHFDYIVSSLEPPVKEKPRGDQPPTEGVGALVSQVKELLPHLGDGFIELCLKEFGNSPETVVDRVLEDNLPASLKEVNQSASADDIRKRSLQAKTESTQSPGTGLSPEKASLLEERRNVFDNDEFDVFSKDVNVDLSRVHFGKRHAHTSASAVLDDKVHLSRMRGVYKQYEVESTWSHQGGPGGERKPGFEDGYEFDQYSDEYDDTYDSHIVGVADYDSSEELFSVRRLNDKGQFSQHYSQFLDSGDEDTEPTSGASNVTLTPGHVTILQRDRKEHTASKPTKSRAPNQSPIKPHSSKSHSPRSHTADNKPAEGKRSHQQKEKNKASRANHNRKAMADKKRSRGMGGFPA